MTFVTILSGLPEKYEDDDLVISHLVEIRARSLVEGDIEAVIEELKWYKDLRDHAESITEEDRINWKQLHGKYQKLSDDQILELIHKLEESENGDYINQ